MSGQAAHFPAATALGLGAENLTPEQVRARLQAIGDNDPEHGHSVADQLLIAALTLIRDGYPRPAELAAAALTVNSADFPRWYA